MIGPNEPPIVPPATVIAVGNRDWNEIWREIKLQLPAGFAARPDFSRPPLSNIVIWLRTPLRCAQVLVGYPFRDEDYVYDYLHNFGGSFDEFGKECVRLHFFSGAAQLTSENVIDRLREISRPRIGATSEGTLAPGGGDSSAPAGQETGESVRQAYLGFMVLRPTGEQCVGRTILRCPPPGEAPFIHVRARYTCHVFGSNLVVSGTPFMQQDRASHVCAGAALWSLCYDLHRRYQTPRLFPRQITDIASRYSPHAAFEWGLTAEQMLHVLDHIGCAKDVFSVRFSRLDSSDKRERLLRGLVDLIYGYVQSNIPVILSYWPHQAEGKDEPGDGHAVLVVGHDYSDTPTGPVEAVADARPAACAWSSQYVRTFYVQDDKRGPYQPIRIWTNDRDWSSRGGLDDDDGTTVLQRARKIVLLPGLSGAVRMTYRDAKREVENWFSLLKDLFDRKLSRAANVDEAAAARDQLASLEEIERQARFRLYLQLISRFREQLLDVENGRTGLGAPVIDVYCRIPMPTHVWVCDFCGRQSRVEAPYHGRFELLGEMILDATAPRFAHDTAQLAYRIHDRLLIRVNGAWKEIEDKDYFDRPLHSAPRNVEDYVRAGR